MAVYDTDKYALMYKENATIVAVFWEWRHYRAAICVKACARSRRVKLPCGLK